VVIEVAGHTDHLVVKDSDWSFQVVGQPIYQIADRGKELIAFVNYGSVNCPEWSEEFGNWTDPIMARHGGVTVRPDMFVLKVAIVHYLMGDVGIPTELQIVTVRTQGI
jgi:hypothetical protein